MKKNKYKLIISVLISSLLISITTDLTYAQTSNDNISFTKVDTVYALSLRKELSNGRPVQRYLICKTIDFLKNVDKVNTVADFECNVFKNSILFDEPFFTLNRSATFMDFKNDNDKKKYLNKISVKIKKLNRAYSKTIFLHFKDSSLSFQIAKFSGDFWVLKGDLNKFNRYKDNFIISSGCYVKDFEYNLRIIDRVFNLNTNESELLKKMK